MNNRVESNGLLMDTRTRAQLKRTDPWEVRGAYEWVRRVKSRPAFAGINEAVLMGLAPVIAEVRAERSGSFGKALRGAASEIRMRRFLACDRDELNEQLGRMIRLLKREVPIEDIVATAVFWGDARRRQLAQDYFALDDDDGE